MDVDEWTLVALSFTETNKFIRIPHLDLRQAAIDVDQARFVGPVLLDPPPHLSHDPVDLRPGRAARRNGSNRQGRQVHMVEDLECAVGGNALPEAVGKCKEAVEDAVVAIRLSEILDRCPGRRGARASPRPLQRQRQAREYGASCMISCRHATSRKAMGARQLLDEPLDCLDIFRTGHPAAVRR